MAIVFYWESSPAVPSPLALYLFPVLRQRITRAAADVRDAVSDGLQRVSTRVADVLDRVADTADEVTTLRQTVRDDVAHVVERGAHAVVHTAREVERFAKAATTDHHEKHA